MEATVRNARVDEIKVKVCRRIGMFEWVLYEVVVCLLPECIMGMDTVSFGRTPLLPSVIK